MTLKPYNHIPRRDIMNTKTNKVTTQPTKDLPKVKVIPKEVNSLPTVSAKIRHLNGLGWSRSEIAKSLNKRYQHVRNVLTTPLKKDTNKDSK